MNETLREELLRMVEEDERVREDLAGDGSLFEGYHPLMEEVHRRNAAALRTIIRKYGWPSIHLVGQDGEEAAWRVAQHSIGEPEFMRNVLQLVQSAAQQRQAPLYQVAFLEDRIRFFEGRMQLYGTSFDWNEHGRLVPFPAIENPEQVDERRAEMGLQPLEEEIRRQNASGESPPQELHKRRKQMNEWAKDAGWRKVKG